MKSMKITAAVTAAVMVITGANFTALAKTRDGCSLVPVSMDETGVLPGSAFKLSGDVGDDPIITINGDEANIEKSGSEWVITPEETLEYNKLYTFTLERENPVTWTFQTAGRFGIERTLPGANGTLVPVSTGIEITFTNDNFDIADVEGSTSFTPAITGNWQKEDSTAVFVPDKPLEYDSDYTVAVSGDVKDGNGKSMGDDYSFTFYTESSEDADNNAGFALYTYDSYIETMPQESIEITYSVLSVVRKTLDITGTVYRVSDEAAAEIFYGTSTLNQLSKQVTESVFSKSETLSLDEDRYSTGQTFNIDADLSRGFYCIELAAGGKKVYTLLQVTRAAAYAIKDNENYLIWLNDYSSGTPLAGCTVSTDTTKATADADGLVTIASSDQRQCLTVSDSSGVIGCFPLRGYIPSTKKYRAALVTDRSLYKGDDTVEFFGTVRGVSDNATPENLTAELYSSYRYGGIASPIAVGEITYATDTFSGRLELPELGEGYYTLYIKGDGKYVTSTTVHVDEYVKPAYELTAESDKKAIFYGDSANVTFSAGFFEGTALPGLDVSYNHHGWECAGGSGSGTTDSKGQFVATITPTLSADTQGSGYYSVNAYATLPESGDISVNTSFRVFYNNIEITEKSRYKDGKSIVDIHSNKVTLDRINDGTAENYLDYIDGPDAGRTINGTLIFNRYIRTEDGTYYDSFTKRTVTRYSYDVAAETVETVTLTTDDNGDATYEFTPEYSSKDGFYTFKVSAVDDMNRTYTESCYVRTGGVSGRIYSNDEYCAQLNQDKFVPGDEAVVTVTRGAESATDKILFIKAFNGIKDAHISSDGVYSTTFDGIPREYVYGIVFEPGAGYKMVAYETLEYDTDNSRLDIDVKPENDTLAPGEECTLDITVRDKDGNGTECDVFVTVVDKALLALSKNDNDILDELCGGYFAGVSTVYRSRPASYAADGGGGGAATAASSEESADTASGSSNSDAYVRSEYKDTAYVTMARTSSDGTAKVTFTLPDNITSWQADVYGITGDLCAGNGRTEIDATLPAFISCAMAESYIVGDTPTVGVTLYGSELDGDEDASFTVTTASGETLTASGKPFERVNIALPELDTIGDESIIVTASADGKTADATKLQYTVTDTYNRTRQAKFYSSPYDDISCGEGGNVNIVFTDNSRAAIVSDVLWLGMRGMMRLDQKVAAYVGQKLLNEVFGWGDAPEEPDLTPYQSEIDDGMRLFTYGDSDLDATAKLTPYIKDMVNVDGLKNYLYDFENDPKALYALAALYEPVLNDMDALAAADNLSAEDYLYLALAYCELGETDTAAEIFSERIDPLIEYTEPTAYVRAGEDTSAINRATALAAVAAQKIGHTSAEPLYLYSTTHFEDSLSLNIEKLAYITAAAQNLPEESGTVTYSLYGTEYTKEFRADEPCTVTVPAKNIGEFKVVSASESVRMFTVSDEKTAVSESSGDDISIERLYKVYGGAETDTFASTDIVEVNITVRFSDAAAEGSYYVTDYLPSGLTAIENKNRGTYAIHADGQKVCLYVRNDDDEHEFICRYYARVTTPGKFTADSAVIQSGTSTDIAASTGKTEITIKDE